MTISGVFLRLDLPVFDSFFSSSDRVFIYPKAFEDQTITSLRSYYYRTRKLCHVEL